MLSKNWAYDDWYVLKKFFCNSIALFDVSCIVLLICSWYLLKVSAFFSKILLLSSWNLFTFSLIFSVVFDTLDAVSLYYCLCCSRYLSVVSLNWLAVFSFITLSFFVEDISTNLSLNHIKINTIDYILFSLLYRKLLLSIEVYIL